MSASGPPLQSEAAASAIPSETSKDFLMTNKAKAKPKKMADLRDGIAGSVLVVDTNANFVGQPPAKHGDGLASVSPDLHEPEGQATHE